MPIYTRTGDQGETGLFGNRRVPKHHLRIETYGTVDELNAQLGLVGTVPGLPREVAANLPTLQSDLFDVGADLASEGPAASLPRIRLATSEMECWIDASELELPPLRTFVLPGGSPAAAQLHVARTVARRAERLFWALHGQMASAGSTRPPSELGTYLNRLSDLLFSWARLANLRNGVADVPWLRRG